MQKWFRLRTLHSTRPSLATNPLLYSLNHRRPSNVQLQRVIALRDLQARSFAFSAIPRFVLHAMRIPVAGVTVGVGGLTYVNYKLNDMATKSSDLLSSISNGFKSAFGTVTDGLSKFDIELQNPINLDL
ncbi:15743_t:CDS:2 [Dentiscutata heterogama]|uniref:15743_t:CDS:1 n=1 Tax=Dentiscutata heterogama TaxID=1316150 RepID=A0ACA9LRG9_9GLOM|nr:15743_t:CDS:2 [Dentiscutata heterogama]